MIVSAPQSLTIVPRSTPFKNGKTFLIFSPLRFSSQPPPPPPSPRSSRVISFHKYHPNAPEEAREVKCDMISKRWCWNRHPAALVTSVVLVYSYQEECSCPKGERSLAPTGCGMSEFRVSYITHERGRTPPPFSYSVPVFRLAASRCHDRGVCLCACSLVALVAAGTARAAIDAPRVQR